MGTAAVRGLIRWGAHYSVGIDEIDREHRELINILNTLEVESRIAYNRDAVARTLQQLIAHVESHFLTEEEMMADSDYPDLDSHKAEHAFLLRQVTEFHGEFKAGRAELTQSMMTYLKDWLRNHLLVADKRLGRFLQAPSQRP